MKQFNRFLDEAGRCWAGYKPVKGKTAYSKGSCVKEGTTSGDSSLHDWFSKSKSSDGKPGWVQLGGRYAGKSCAKQPGQTTKPKCGSSKMAANMSDKEEDAAAKRKRAQDPNPNRSGAPINVPTEGKRKMKESIDEYIAKSECPECGGHMVSEDELTEEKDACYHKVKSRYSVFPSAYASGALVKCRKAGAANWGNKTKQEGTQVIPFKAFINETEAWQRKEGQNSEGGLNRKGIESYRAANPGSKLSMAVTTKPSELKAGSKAANRRKSFCARMGGMKKRLTSAETARDPDSRINKALRKWNC